MEASNHNALEHLNSKQAWRDHIRHAIRDLSPHIRSQRATIIRERLMQRIGDLRPKRIAMYMPLPDEPDLCPIFEELETMGIEINLPRILDDERIEMYRYQQGQTLESNTAYKLLEPEIASAPTPAENLYAIVVPALAFDIHGYRLGRGKGYYDRYLARTSAYRIGVSFDICPISSIRPEAWDIPMHEVIRCA